MNQGLRNARGLYYKVVDSDDWLDTDALKKVLDKLREFARQEKPVDLMVCNYVYEHVEDNTQKVMRYTNVFPENRVFTWAEIGRFRPSQYLLMHSVIYRTELLRDSFLQTGAAQAHLLCGQYLCLSASAYVESIYYMDLDLYRYFIGRADQSVNEKVMVTRVDQQLRVTRLMIDAHDLHQVRAALPKLGRYMFNYLAMMMTISSIFLIIDGSPEALEKDAALGVSAQCGRPYLSQDEVPGRLGRVQHSGLSGTEAVGQLYRLARRIYKFN